jgi:hypothetical protein
VGNFVDRAAGLGARSLERFAETFSRDRSRPRSRERVLLRRRFDLERDLVRRRFFDLERDLVRRFLDLERDFVRRFFDLERDFVRRFLDLERDLLRRFLDLERDLLWRRRDLERDLFRPFLMPSFFASTDNDLVNASSEPSEASEPPRRSARAFLSALLSLLLLVEKPRAFESPDDIFVATDFTSVSVSIFFFVVSRSCLSSIVRSVRSFILFHMKSGTLPPPPPPPRSSR